MQKQLLTADNLRLLYKTFIRLPPFSELAMPEARDVKFKVIRDEELLGLFEPEPLTLMISSGRCSYFDTICKTLLHEMAHMHCYLEDQANYEQHNNRLFKKIIRQIALTYGFDPKEL